MNISEVLSRSIDKIYPSREDLEKILKSGKKLKIYLGVDPTGPHLHLGHATNLLVLSRFQDSGHKIIFLIGDFTGRIGDPTDKLSTRKQLSEREVKENFKTFKKQVSKIIKFSGKNAAKVEFNSRWWKNMKLADFFGILSNFTERQMIQRDMFQERIKNNEPIGLHEFMYPLLQGYDSVAMDVDMEIGGTDQTFNMLIGRDLMRIYKNKNKFVLTTKLLENPKTGKKLMNKSEGGLINLDDEPNDMFGKVMALPDEVISTVAEFSTLMPMDEFGKLKEMPPRDAKARAAHWVVRTFYGEKEAVYAEKEFDKVFRTRELPSDMPQYVIKEGRDTTIAVLTDTGIVSSNSEAVRLVQQGGVTLDGVKITDPRKSLDVKEGGSILKSGKRHFIKVIK
ncbi:MAG: tyrosine--tRNA ligase [Candidatus Colwellbacteria bacterium]|nr:tyrosine--tRNA ligase [Candidatus Colwellbacteria bacterium]